MKKLAILLLAVFSLLIVSCSQSVPDKMVKLADQAEAKGEKWSQEKWEEVAEEFGNLLEEYEANEDSYGAFKKLKVTGACIKFYAAAAKYVVAPEAKKKLENLGEEAEDSGANELLEGLKELGL